jgi:hypothetical protein
VTGRFIDLSAAAPAAYELVIGFLPTARLPSGGGLADHRVGWIAVEGFGDTAIGTGRRRGAYNWCAGGRIECQLFFTVAALTGGSVGIGNRPTPTGQVVCDISLGEG